MTSGAALTPTWSADGRFLAWVEGDRIVVHPLSGGAPHQLAGLLDGLYRPRWSPDSTRIAVWGVESLTRNLQIIDVRTGAVREVLRTTGPPTDVDALWGLAWSRDSQSLIVRGDRRTFVQIDLATSARREVYRSNHDLASEFGVDPAGDFLAMMDYRGTTGWVGDPCLPPGRTVPAPRADARSRQR